MELSDTVELSDFPEFPEVDESGQADEFGEVGELAKVVEFFNAELVNVAVFEAFFLAIASRTIGFSLDMTFSRFLRWMAVKRNPLPVCVDDGA